VADGLKGAGVAPFPAAARPTPAGRGQGSDVCSLDAKLSAPGALPPPRGGRARGSGEGGRHHATTTRAPHPSRGAVHPWSITPAAATSSVTITGSTLAPAVKRKVATSAGSCGTELAT